MGTEVWFRNPDNYIRELVECGQANIAWDRGYLVKKRIDPLKHAHLYYGKAYEYRIFLVGEQGTAEYGPGDLFSKPKAVYPTWRYGDDSAILEEIIERPVGTDVNLCSIKGLPPDETPVLGQEHRVVITDIPVTSSGPGRKFIRYLKELQEDYPACIIHVHGLYGWRVAFGMGFGAADVEPRTAAHKGKVYLPSGREMQFEHVQRHSQWVTGLGFKPADLAIPRNRCMYNIKSAVWAGENYEKLYKFKTAGEVELDVTTPDASYVPAETKTYLSKNKKALPGDHFQCDTCSLQDACKYYRDGAVCSVPGADPIPLARMFKTRDSATILDGLGTLLAAQTNRLEQGMQEEKLYGELDPEVTKIANQVFGNAVQLAKLLDPNLRGGTKVQVNVGAGGAAAVAMATPQQLIGAAVRELELQGISRDKITSGMIQGLLEGMASQDKTRAAIEGTVIEHESKAE